MAQKDRSNVEILGSGGKCSTTATFAVKLDEISLPMQFIYDGKTDRSISQVNFLREFSLNASPKHFSNTDESIKIINEMLDLYFESRRMELRLDEGFPALLILDVFRSQMTDKVTSLLGEKNILIVKVPNNMMHLVNGWVKRWMRQRFGNWYTEQIRTGLDNGLQLESIEVKMTLTGVKPLHARWLIELIAL